PWRTGTSKRTHKQRRTNKPHPRRPAYAHLHRVLTGDRKARQCRARGRGQVRAVLDFGERGAVFACSRSWYASRRKTSQKLKRGMESPSSATSSTLAYHLLRAPSPSPLPVPSLRSLRLPHRWWRWRWSQGLGYLHRRGGIQGVHPRFTVPMERQAEARDD
ncbi:hypothetical protein C8R45DRAFT_1042036, partial [Mycena sanguinolenta]